MSTDLTKSPYIYVSDNRQIVINKVLKAWGLYSELIIACRDNPDNTELRDAKLEAYNAYAKCYAEYKKNEI